MRASTQFLQQATPTAPAESLTKLVAVLFHLGTLGVLALISVIDIPADNETEGVVLRLGIVLLIIGIAHWIAVSALSRIRDSEKFEEYSAERDARRQAHDQAMRAAGTYVPEPTEALPTPGKGYGCGAPSTTATLITEHRTAR